MTTANIADTQATTDINGEALDSAAPLRRIGARRGPNHEGTLPLREDRGIGTVPEEADRSMFARQPLVRLSFPRGSADPQHSSHRAHSAGALPSQVTDPTTSYYEGGPPANWEAGKVRSVLVRTTLRTLTIGYSSSHASA